jgi:hypothetical protein
MIFCLASCLISVLYCSKFSYAISWLSFYLKQCMTYTLPNYENNRPQSILKFQLCKLGNQGMVLIHKVITELLTTFLGKNTTYKCKNTDSKTIDIANCKTSKRRLLAAEQSFLKTYYYQTVKTVVLYESRTGLTGWPAETLPNSGRFGDYCWTVPNLTVQVYWHPGPPVLQLFSSDLDPDLKQQSRTMANTMHQFLGSELHSKTESVPMT